MWEKNQCAHGKLLRSPSQNCRLIQEHCAAAGLPSGTLTSLCHDAGVIISLTWWIKTCDCNNGRINNHWFRQLLTKGFLFSILCPQKHDMYCHFCWCPVCLSHQLHFCSKWYIFELAGRIYTPSPALTGQRSNIVPYRQVGDIVINNCCQWV